MFFSRKDKDKEQYEDPAMRYGRMLKRKDGGENDDGKKPSLLARIFSSGPDSDFVYYDD